MKKILFVVLGIFIFQLINAQDTISYTTKKHEINIGYFNMFNLNAYYNTVGIGFKCSGKKVALRIGTGFNYYNSNYKSTSNTNNRKDLLITPMIGIEFKQSYKRINVFYGSDVRGIIQQEISNSSSSSNSEQSEYGMGLSPFIGIKYFINKRISISTETSFNILYSKQIYKFTSPNSPFYESNSKTLSANLSPLGIFSINFHF